MHALQPAITGLSPKTPYIPLHNRSVGGQVGRVFTHWIVGKFVESDGAKGALGPAFFAMAARLTREVGRTQVANGQVKRKRGAAHFNKCAAPF